ncbi:MAG: tripartite tricarboxylate transporter TctB family protein [Spirochaetaceae bacterium]
MEEKKLRQYDFVTAIGLILFSFWELAEALKMPMKESYGGVQNDWYVSPALLPLFIGLGILLLGTLLLVNAIKSGGAKSFIDAAKASSNMKLTVETKRVFTTVLALFTFIFLLIPNVDFFLSIILFLFVICSAFLPDEEEYRKIINGQLIIAAIVLSVIAFTGVGDLLRGVFKYTLDILALLFIIYINIYSRIKAKGFNFSAKILRKITIISIIVPLILCPLFRYFLLVPLPVEGGIIKLMNLLYYTIR